MTWQILLKLNNKTHPVYKVSHILKKHYSYWLCCEMRILDSAHLRASFSAALSIGEPELHSERAVLRDRGGGGTGIHLHHQSLNGWAWIPALELQPSRHRRKYWAPFHWSLPKTKHKNRRASSLIRTVSHNWSTRSRPTSYADDIMFS